MEGLLPVATSNSNGLLSASDKKTGMWIYAAFKYNMYEIIKERVDWQRSYAILVGAFEAKPVHIIVGYYRQGSGNITINIKWLTDKVNNIKFYKKEYSVYVFFNISDESPNYLHIATKNGIELISTGVQPDSSYELIE